MSRTDVFFLLLEQFRRGDMELTKGRNLIEHEMEIKARPARTWFQTSSEKAAAKSGSTCFLVFILDRC